MTQSLKQMGTYIHLKRKVSSRNKRDSSNFFFSLVELGLELKACSTLGPHLRHSLLWYFGDGVLLFAQVGLEL
jgi:hypothetical protein